MNVDDNTPTSKQYTYDSTTTNENESLLNNNQPNVDASTSNSAYVIISVVVVVVIAGIIYTIHNMDNRSPATEQTPLGAVNAHGAAGIVPPVHNTPLVSADVNQKV